MAFGSPLGAQENRLIFDERHEGVYARKDAYMEAPGREKTEAEKNREVLKGQLEEKIKKYNENYSASDYFKNSYRLVGDSERKRKEYPQEQPLDFSDPKKLRAQIDLLLDPDKTKFTYNGFEYPLSDVGVFTDRVSQYQDLQDIDTDLKALEGAGVRVTESMENLSGTHEERMVQRMDHVQEILNSKTEWAENFDSNEATSAFERAVESPLLSDNAFDSLRRNASGEISEQALRENKHLFLSILKSQTNNFAPGSFVLGPNFKDDWKENRKNFPFIYHEWLKYNKGIGGGEMEAQEGEVGQAEAKAKIKRTEIPQHIDGLLAPISGLGIKNRVSDVQTQGVSLSEYYRQVASSIKDIQGDIGQKKNMLRATDPNNANITTCEEKIEKLDPVYDLALAMSRYYKAEEELNEAGGGFTLSSLSDRKNYQMLIELSLRQFLKSQEIVDKSYGENGGLSRGLMHPSVRRHLISMVFMEGVARYRNVGPDKVEYVPSTAPEYRWMLAELAQSPYFNALGQGRFVDAEQREFLLVARYANLALTKENATNERIEKMNGVIQLMASNPTDPSIDTTIAEIGKYVHGSDRQTPLSRANIDQALTREKAALATWIKFRTEAEELMHKKPAEGQSTVAYKDQMKADIRGFMDRLKTDTTSYDALNEVDNATIIGGFAPKIQSVDLAYHAMELNEKSRANILEYLGINTEGFYTAFLNYRKQHPEMRVDNWDSFLLQSGDVEKLIAMFQATIPESKVAGGKEDFIMTLRTLHGQYPNKTRPESMNAQSVAIETYEMLKKEVQHREQVADATAKGDAELKSRLEGMTWGDKATEYGKAVIDMVIGPGQSLANRAAGVAMLVLAWKLIKKGYKGEGKLGQFLRYAGLAGAAELLIKHVTGEGILDRIKLSGIADAMKGTYESVLIKRAEGAFKEKEISADEHARALSEMNKVPFKDLMMWYEKSTDAGRPLEGERDIFPKKINTYNIVKGMTAKERDEKMRARFVVKNVMRNFLDYVGNKNQGDHRLGREILMERWIKAVEDKTFDLEKAKKSEIELPQQAVVEQFRKNPRALTWQIVMNAEIRPEDVDAVTEDGFLNSLTKKAREMANKAVGSLRVDVWYPTGVAAEQYYEKLATVYGPEIKSLASKGYNFAEQKKDELVVWWGTSQDAVRIRRTGSNLWSIAEAGVAAPWGATIHAAEWSSGSIKDLIQKADIRRKEWLENERKITYNLFPRGLDLTDLAKQGAEKQARGLLLINQVSNGYELFGRFERDFYQVDGPKRRLARGILAEPQFMTNPMSRFRINEAEGYVNFVGVGSKGNVAEAYRDGINNLIQFLKTRTNLIDQSKPEGRKLVQAIDTEDEDLVRESIERYVDRFGAFDTPYNGYLLCLHFPFPTNSTAETWQEEVIKIDPRTKQVLPPPQYETRIVKYRDRYEQMTKGKEYPRFENYKHSIVFSVLDDPIAEGYIEKPPARGQWWSGNYIENYMKEFHLWNGNEAKTLISFAFGTADGALIADYGINDNKADALFKAVVAKKDIIAERHLPERDPTATFKTLSVYGSKATAETFRDIHTFLDEYFASKTIVGRAEDVKDWVQGGDSFKLKYRQFLMEKLSEKYRESKGKRKITPQDVKEVSKQFIEENRGIVENLLKRLVKGAGKIEGLLEKLIKNKYYSIEPNPPKRTIK